MYPGLENVSFDVELTRIMKSVVIEINGYVFPIYLLVTTGGLVMIKIAGFFLLLLSVTAEAAIVIPGDLNSGDAYHVIFITSEYTQGESEVLLPSLNDYDARVESAAINAGIDSVIDWVAVVSVYGVNARDHVATLFSDLNNIPIYNQGGLRVANSWMDLWDGSVLNPVQYNEFGLIQGAHQAWTGTAEDGTALDPLDSPSPLATVGAKWAADGGWISLGPEPKEDRFTAGFYGISSQLTIVSPVPVPAALWLFATALIGLFGIKARRKTV